MALPSREYAAEFADKFLEWYKRDMDKNIFDALSKSKVKLSEPVFFKRVLESLDKSELAIAKPSAIYLHGNDMYELEGNGAIKKVTIKKPWKELAVDWSLNPRDIRKPEFMRIVGVDYDMQQKIAKLESTNDALAKEVETLREENAKLRELINTMDVLAQVKEFKIFYEMKKAASNEQEKKDLG